MELCNKGVENGEFYRPKGEFRNRLSGRDRIEIPYMFDGSFCLTGDLQAKKVPLSTLVVADFMRNSR
jgi:hypothetical protein